MRIKAILLDLDDTLLGNPAEPFMRGYMGLLGRFLSERLGTDERAMQALKDGVKAVARSTDPYTTNWDTFYGVFEPALTVTRAAFDEAIDEFYRDVYPQLQAGTQRRPFARPLVEGLLARGLRVAVATNPFFPRTAVEQRLAWAGVPVEQVPFAHVTTLENSHFAKPNPAYFEEVLARLGVMPDETIMVGDDWEHDIVPATRAGLNTWWISAQPPDRTGDLVPDGWGTFDAFAARVQDDRWLEALTPRPLTPEQIGPRLTGNLSALLGIVDQAPPQVWSLHPDPAEWSPLEVLCHLQDSEARVQRPRLEQIAREENPLLAPVPPYTPGSCGEADVARRVALAFGAEREQTLAFLASLRAEQWERPARHHRLGATTLLAMAQFTAQHDRAHLTQLRETIAKFE